MLGNAPLVFVGSTSLVYEPIITGTTGDRGVGRETGNRLPPAYPIIAAASVPLPPGAIGANAMFRNTVMQATSQPIRNWLPSKANTEQKKPAKQEG